MWLPAMRRWGALMRRYVQLGENHVCCLLVCASGRGPAPPVQSHALPSPFCIEQVRLHTSPISITRILSTTPECVRVCALVAFRLV